MPNIFLNSRIENAKGLEAAGNVMLAPVRLLWNGKTIANVTSEMHVRDSFDAKERRSLKNRTLSMIALPFGFTIGSILKGVSYLGQDARDHHLLAKRNFETLSERPLVSKSNPTSNCSQDPKNQHFGAMELSDATNAAKSLREDKMTKGCNAVKFDFLINLFTKDNENVIPLNFTTSYLQSIDPQNKTVITPFLELHTWEAVDNAMGNVLQFYKELLNSSPQKIMITVGVKNPVPHALLIVAEISSEDETQAHITLIDSLGNSSMYKDAINRLAETTKRHFSSNKTTIVKNPVSQQSDGRTCGFQQLENILLLIKQPDIQQFVAQGNLPVRSENKMKKRLKFYGEKAQEVLESIC